jgi:septum site-determining protein MinD
MAAKTIVIMSQKGGVGKTTVSANLAAAIADMGKRVLLIDANVDTPHIAVYYGIVGYKYSLEDVLSNLVHVNEAIYKTSSPNLHILPSRVFKKRGDANAKYKVINLFHQINKLSDAYDFIIIDSKPAESVNFVKLIGAAEIIIVSTPDITSAIEAKKLTEESALAGVNVRGLIINRINKRSDAHMNKIEFDNVVGAGWLWEIPEDLAVFEALRAGIPIVWYKKKNPAAKAFISVADSLIGGD